MSTVRESLIQNFLGLMSSVLLVALLRPGRFEVQVEVPPPRSMDQRVSILKVHTHSMHEAGRLLVSDPPVGTTASRIVEVSTLFAWLDLDQMRHVRFLTPDYRNS